MLIPGDLPRGKCRPQRRNHAAMRRRSNCSAIRSWSYAPPGVVVFEATGSPCRRLCLNGGWLQLEPICKFGRNAAALKLSGCFCDAYPFAGKTIHRRADIVMAQMMHANIVPLATTFSSSLYLFSSMRSSGLPSMIIGHTRSHVAAFNRVGRAAPAAAIPAMAKVPGGMVWPCQAVGAAASCGSMGGRHCHGRWWGRRQRRQRPAID